MPYTFSKTEKKEAKVSKAIKYIIGGGLLTGAIFGIVNLTKSANAATKLDIDVDAFSLKETKKNPFGIPTTLIYTVKLKINNPTDKALTIGKPYIKLFVKKADGSLAKIANTETPEGADTTIKAKASTLLSHDIEIRLQNAIAVLPNFITYIIGRIRGDKSTQKAVADITIDAMGTTFSTQEVINL